MTMFGQVTVLYPLEMFSFFSTYIPPTPCIESKVLLKFFELMLGEYLLDSSEVDGKNMY